MGGDESLADRLARQARDLAESAGAKTGQMARIGRLQLDLMGIKREIQKEYRLLGERLVQLIRSGQTSGIEEDTVVQAGIDRLQRFEAERLERESQIKEVKATKRRDSDSEGE